VIEGRFARAVASVLVGTGAGAGRGRCACAIAVYSIWISSRVL
jgi:hypothetical protein